MPPVDLLEETELLVRRFATVRARREPAALAVSGADPWSIDCSFRLVGDEEFRVRPLRDGDVPLLLQFAASLGPVSRDHFCPYPWEDQEQLVEALADAVERSLGRVSLAFLLLRNNEPVGHFFLWKAGGNPHSAAYELEIPELGVAIADSQHGRGLGGLAVRLLLPMARSLRADAVELTTARSNSAGWATYIGAGFEYVGNILNPLEVDVTAATLGEVQATRYREERQMVCVLEPARREQVMAYLALKRSEAR